MQDWTTESLARLAGISPFHFYRIFRALTGETMFAFLQRRKLLHAMELINEDRFTLTEIALELRKLLKHRIAENEAHTPNETGQKGKDRNARNKRPEGKTSRRTA